MIAAISMKISKSLLKSNAINQDELNVYAYGIQLLILGIVDWCITFLFMLLIGEIYLSVVYLLVFFVLRKHCGVYHVGTDIQCIIISNAVYVLSVLVSANMQYEYFTTLLLIGEIINFIIIYKFSPVEHPNKHIEPIEMARHRKLGIIYNLMFELVAVGLVLGDINQYACAILMAQLSVSIAVILQRRKNRTRKEGSENG